MGRCLRGDSNGLGWWWWCWHCVPSHKSDRRENHLKVMWTRAASMGVKEGCFGFASNAQSSMLCPAMLSYGAQICLWPCSNLLSSAQLYSAPNWVSDMRVNYGCGQVNIGHPESSSLIHPWSVLVSLGHLIAHPAGLHQRLFGRLARLITTVCGCLPLFLSSAEQHCE